MRTTPRSTPARPVRQMTTTTRGSAASAPITRRSSGPAAIRRSQMRISSVTAIRSRSGPPSCLSFTADSRRRTSRCLTRFCCRTAQAIRRRRIRPMTTGQPARTAGTTSRRSSSRPLRKSSAKFASSRRRRQRSRQSAISRASRSQASTTRRHSTRSTSPY